MFCTNCGNNLNGKSFCTQCGKEYKKVDTSFENSNNKNNKKLLLGLCGIILILVGVLVLALNKDNIFNKNGDNSRTIMIYMVGADLESKSGMATVDLKEIDGTKVDLEHDNVLLIAGGSKRWDNSIIDVSETSIFKLEKDGFKKVLKQDIKNMGNDKVLSDFLKYAYNNYHTDNYDLIFWNHGGGIFGSEYDELNDDDQLTLIDMGVALKNSPFNSNNKLELVMFRTCLNGTIEVANTFKDYADYLVASEEVTRSFGMDSALSFINTVNKDDSSVDVGKKFIDTYKDTIGNGCIKYGAGTKECVTTTYSITDLSKIDDLNKFIANFFSDLNSKLDNNYDMIARARNNTFAYAEDAKNDFELVDLYSIVDSLQTLSPEYASTLLENIKDTVVYNYSTNMYSNGLSVYFPYYHDEILEYYKIIANNKELSDFMVNFYNHKTNKKVSTSFSFNNSTITKGDKDNGSIKADLSLELTDEQLKDYAKSEYIMFVKVDDNFYTPIRRSSDIELKGNVLEAHVRGKQLRISSVDDSISYWLLLGEKERTDDYVKYENTVNLWKWNFDDPDKDMEAIVARLEIMVDKDHPNGVITQVTEIHNNNKSKDNKSDDPLKAFALPSVKIEDINYYDTITFALGKYKILDDKGNYIENWESSGQLEGLEGDPGEFKFTQEDFKDEYEYYCVFRIYDTAGNYHYSNLVKMN